MAQRPDNIRFVVVEMVSMQKNRALAKRHPQTRKKFKQLVILSVISAATICSTSAGRLPASAQTEHWDTKRRAESQRLSSTAINFLNTRYSGGSKKNTIKNLDQAISLLQRAVATDDSDPLPHYLLGLCLNIQGRYDQALDMLRRAYQLDPDEEEILLATGMTQYLNGQYDKAITLWEKLLREHKEMPGPTHALLGFAYMRMGDFESSAKNFSQSKAISPGSQLPYQGLAILNYLAGDLTQSKQTAEHAQSLGDYPLLSLLLARIHYLEGNDSAALEQLKVWKKQSAKYVPRSMTVMGFSRGHDFRLDPFENEIYDSPGALLARSINDEKKEKRRKSLTRQGKVDQSLTRTRKLTAINASDYVALHETGMLQLSSGDFKGAVSSFQDVLRICPNCRVDFIYLAEAFSKSGDTENAKRSLEYYQKTYPRQPLAARYTAIATFGSTTPPPLPANVSDKPLLPGERPQDAQKPPSKDSPF